MHIAIKERITIQRTTSGPSLTSTVCSIARVARIAAAVIATVSVGTSSIRVARLSLFTLIGVYVFRKGNITWNAIHTK